MDLLIRGIDLQYVVGEFNRGDISYGICIYIYINSLLLNEV